MNSLNTKTLWMGDIDNTIEEEYMFIVFESLKIKLKNVRIMRDKITGQRQDFETSEEAKFFLENFNGKPVPGTNRYFKLNWATHNNSRLIMNNVNTCEKQNNNFESGPFLSYNSQKIQPHNKFKKNFNCNSSQDFTIYVGDLDLYVNEEILGSFFSGYPSIITIKLITESVTKVSRGYAFIKFGNFYEFQCALREMDGRILMNRPVKVNPATNKKPFIGESPHSLSNETHEHRNSNTNYFNKNELKNVHSKSKPIYSNEWSNIYRSSVVSCSPTYNIFSNLNQYLLSFRNSFNSQQVTDSRCRLNSLLYYYNILDIDTSRNSTDQFYISLSKYGHLYNKGNFFINFRYNELK